MIWRVRDIAEAHLDADDQLACWSAQSAAGRSRAGGRQGIGPIFGTVGPLPADARGRPRFYVHATFAGNGMSVGRQLSIWKWDGSAAIPLLIKPYSFTLDVPGGFAFDGDTIRLRTKQYMKTFYTFGPSPDPVGLWTLRVTPQGVQDLGIALEEPAFQLIDDLLDRVGRGQDASNLAARRVTVQLATLRGRGDEPGIHLGGVFQWERKPIDGGDAFALETDLAKLVFTIKSRRGKPFVTAVKVIGLD